jgi:DNA-binding NarL/FixJ family response regulator
VAKRVLIADDNKLVRRAIRTLLAKWPDVEICGEADDGRKTIEAAVACRPDVLILDVRMPELNGIEVASLLKKTLPEIKTVLFTMYSDHVGRDLAAAAGIDVILPKVDGLSALTDAINSLLRTGVHLASNPTSSNRQNAKGTAASK